jgi:ubiquinone/menaquinone biosynthesis C-methylase UbiE
MTAPRRRSLNSTITRFWSFAAPAYDAQFLQHWVYRPAHDELIEQLRAHQSRRVVDVACGTGILADRIERELDLDKIYGVDMSDGMLDQARARSTRVQWSRGAAEQLPVADGAFDAVVTTSAFHFLNHTATLREFHRVLSPSGLVVVTAMSARQSLLHGHSASKWKPAHNASPAELRALFENAGFAVSEQHRVRRPVWTRIVVSDLITVGVKS